ncbi:type III-A CRISPR-associated RAMP protein Csm3 [Nitrosomonas nitrosa]|uniref:CRISPR system Cms endoribonuclease Csm3 n=1 Tax=Nitrosomonas nitrosa TaxID=52442 RepID=A0A1I4LNX6_9PROT|nr:type III-A CRISPR-associated RAMP protein Csm3 [Nitrosomonas nitrosa]MCO6433924.1 type III-A CRISPR-associated RAMP protein Csm3 [Nitrosomonas nitrosa]SFL92808.1 CRISPR-associated protein, Csm3 family [Nitrosomonas nitrosa]
MQLTRILQIKGIIELKSGLHIGGGDSEMRIGGIDNPVIKDAVSDLPYIPGSSLKGKVRSLLEWQLGLVAATGGSPFSFQHLKKTDTPDARALLKLFGGAPGGETDFIAKEIGPSRLAFWDCPLNTKWKERVVDARNILVTEAKSENTINRITGVAANPRYTERVVADAQFDFMLSIKIHDEEDLLGMVLTGLKLLEYDSLGASGSRGYGKIRFLDLKMDDEPLQARLDQIQPFASMVGVA